MTHFQSLSVEPQHLTIETALHPIQVISREPDFTSFLTASSEVEVISLQGNSTAVLAQFDDVDVLADIVNLWNTFIESGQVWALIIGLIIGYFLRGLTTYS